MVKNGGCKFIYTAYVLYFLNNYFSLTSAGAADKNYSVIVECVYTETVWPQSPEQLYTLTDNKSNIRWTLRATVARLPIGTAGLLATQVKLRPLSVSAGVMGR